MTRGSSWIRWTMLENSNVDLGEVGAPGDRRGGRRVRRAGERDVALAGEQTRRRVEADPAGAGDVHLGPGVQVGEVGRGPVGAVNDGWSDVELHEVARHEPRRETEVAQDLDEQPAGVAARAEPRVERLLGRLHAGLHADRVLDVAVEPPVERRRGSRRSVSPPRTTFGRQPARQPRTDRCRRPEVRLEVGGQLWLVAEREGLGGLLDEEVERVDDRQVGDQVDGDVEQLGWLGEDEPGHEVAERVLLPVDEVFARRDAEAVRRGSASGSAAQAAAGARADES